MESGADDDYGCELDYGSDFNLDDEAQDLDGHGTVDPGHDPSDDSHAHQLQGVAAEGTRGHRLYRRTLYLERAVRYTVGTRSVHPRVPHWYTVSTRSVHGQYTVGKHGQYTVSTRSVHGR